VPNRFAIDKAQRLSKHYVALLLRERNGVKTAGDAILFQLKSLGEAQAETLARRLRISVQAVRQRLERLLAEALVTYSDRAQGRGRGGSGRWRRARHRCFPIPTRSSPST
jgi:predicted ArsR family transcriptional regulator